jgi:hypothetical protein
MLDTMISEHYLKLNGKAVQRYGRRIIKQIRGMFETIERKGAVKEEEWEEMMYQH